MCYSLSNYVDKLSKEFQSQWNSFPYFNLHWIKSTILQVKICPFGNYLKKIQTKATPKVNWEKQNKIQVRRTNSLFWLDLSYNVTKFIPNEAWTSAFNFCIFILIQHDPLGNWLGNFSQFNVLNKNNWQWSILWQSQFPYLIKNNKRKKSNHLLYWTNTTWVFNLCKQNWGDLKELHNTVFLLLKLVIWQKLWKCKWCWIEIGEIEKKEGGTEDRGSTSSDRGKGLCWESNI